MFFHHPAAAGGIKNEGHRRPIQTPNVQARGYPNVPGLGYIVIGGSGPSL